MPAAGPSGPGPERDDPNALPAGRPLPPGAAGPGAPPPADVPGGVLGDLLSALGSMLVAKVGKWALWEWESLAYLFTSQRICAVYTMEKKNWKSAEAGHRQINNKN